MSEVEKVFLGNVRRQFMAEEQKAEERLCDSKEIDYR